MLLSIIWMRRSNPGLCLCDQIVISILKQEHFTALSRLFRLVPTTMCSSWVECGLSHKKLYNMCSIVSIALGGWAHAITYIPRELEKILHWSPSKKSSLTLGEDQIWVICYWRNHRRQWILRLMDPLFPFEVCSPPDTVRNNGKSDSSCESTSDYKDMEAFT